MIEIEPKMQVNGTVSGKAYMNVKVIRQKAIL
jgi:hypothetical protein